MSQQNSGGRGPNQGPGGNAYAPTQAMEAFPPQPTSASAPAPSGNAYAPTQAMEAFPPQGAPGVDPNAYPPTQAMEAFVPPSGPTPQGGPPPGMPPGAGMPGPYGAPQGYGPPPGMPQGYAPQGYGPPPGVPQGYSPPGMPQGYGSPGMPQGYGPPPGVAQGYPPAATALAGPPKRLWAGILGLLFALGSAVSAASVNLVLLPAARAAMLYRPSGYPGYGGGYGAGGDAYWVSRALYGDAGRTAIAGLVGFVFALVFGMLGKRNAAGKIALSIGVVALLVNLMAWASAGSKMINGL